MARFDAPNFQGVTQSFYIDGYQANALDIAKHRVLNLNWDYLAIIAGLPGSGKSTMSWTAAKYCCPWFSEKYVAFSDQEFIQITNDCPEYSAVVLDESFASLNTKIGMSPEFLNIINHLQIIRQKHLFIFLCLPNFFDLSKGISVFRSSHLFVCYDDEGVRGPFLAFDRESKRNLFVKGNKFMDYSIVRANFRGTFVRNEGIIDEKAYEAKKKAHLLAQRKEKDYHGLKSPRDEIIWKLYSIKKWSCPQIAELTGLSLRQVEALIKFRKEKS